MSDSTINFEEMKNKAKAKSSSYKEAAQTFWAETEQERKDGYNAVSQVTSEIGRCATKGFGYVIGGLAAVSVAAFLS